MKKKLGFTLVELLAVIVILAIILIIAIPKISDVIKNSKEASLETTAKLIASQAEKKYTENQVLDASGTIKCNDVAKISDTDYESCNITFDDKGNAKVTIVGKGKFDGLQIINGTKNSASSISTAPTDTSYFTYSDVEGGISITGFEIGTVGNVEVVDVDKCKSYFQTTGTTEEDAIILCNGGALSARYNYNLHRAISLDDISSSDYEAAGLKVEYIIVQNVEVVDVDKCKTYFTNLWSDDFAEEDATTICTTENGLSALKYFVANGLSDFYIPSSDYETAGLTVKSNPFNRITNVVIPSQIDGKTVVAISDNAFKYKLLISVSMPDTITNIGNSAFTQNHNLSYAKLSNGITSIPDNVFAYCSLDTITIPDGVTVIGERAFYSNQLVEMELSKNLTTIGISAFVGNNLTNVTIPDSVVEIGASAFYGNKLTNVTIPASVTSMGKDSFGLGCGGITCTDGVCECYVASGNVNLSTIVNTTGKSFDWDNIINASTKGRYTFETGTVASDNKANWNIEITK